MNPNMDFGAFTLEKLKPFLMKILYPNNILKVETPPRKRSPMPATPTMGKVSFFSNAKILALF